MEGIKKYMPYLCILGAGTSWGFMGLFSKIILAGGYSSFTVVLIRNFGALVMLQNINKKHEKVYAEQVLVSLEQNLNQLQEIVKNGQLSLERHRAESEGQFAGNYANQRPEYAQDFRMN